jgi:hypothetical protein
VIRKHPVTLRHALLAATKSYKPDVLDIDQQETALDTITKLIMEMWNIPWSEDAYDSVTEVITGKISLEAGMAMLNAFARRQAEKDALERRNA